MLPRVVPKPSPRKRIMTACADNTFIYRGPCWSIPFFKLTRNDARFDLGGTTALTINHASTIAAGASADGGAQTVTLSKGEVISALGGHAGGESVEAVAFVNIVGAIDGMSAPAGSASFNTVVTGATDGKICIWDLKTNQLCTTLEVSPAFYSPLTFATWRSFLSFDAD